MTGFFVKAKTRETLQTQQHLGFVLKEQPTEVSSLILSISTRTDSAIEEKVSGNDKLYSRHPDLDEGRVKLPSGSFHLDRAWTEKITQGKKTQRTVRPVL